MSDLGPVNPLFNAKLKAVREELLPKVISDWHNLDEAERKEMGDMGNFFCKLHLLSNFASETDKVLNEFEKLMINEDHEKKYAFSTKESSPVQLIRLACKAFHVRGSDECGVASYFNAYLSDINCKSYLESFIGNRFNILFYNASALYFHKDSSIDFLCKFPNPNNLLKSVDELINNPFNLACVRGLGIVNKVATGPLWRICEKMSTLEMTPYLVDLKLKLDNF